MYKKYVLKTAGFMPRLFSQREGVHVVLEHDPKPEPAENFGQRIIAPAERGGELNVPVLSVYDARNGDGEAGDVFA